MGKNRGICTLSYYAVSLIIAAISGAFAVLCLQLYKRQIVRQTLLQMRDFQGMN
jgi:hypothetical protein